MSLLGITAVGNITRTFDSIEKAVVEIANSRVFIGLHFQFAVDEARKAGYVLTSIARS